MCVHYGNVELVAPVPHTREASQPPIVVHILVLEHVCMGHGWLTVEADRQLVGIEIYLFGKKL
jgi:hypothetical protein